MQHARFETAECRREPLGTSVVTIVGVVRDCARHLRRNVKILREAFSEASGVRFIVVESDSRDDTLAVLRALEGEMADFHAITLGRIAERFPQRTERIAHCRNRYLEELANERNPWKSGYVVVADLDGVNASLNRRAVDSCFASPEAWDVCAANQRDFYYDVWALRHPTWSPDDCWVRYRSLLDIVGPNQALELAVHTRMVRLDPKGPMIDVDSAFGGLAIYRAAALQGARYEARLPDGSMVCEHVPLHAGIGANGHRIVINPALVNARSTGHVWHKKFLARSVRWLVPTLYRPDPQATLPQNQAIRLLKKMKLVIAP